jgi:hypothetical protein
MKCKIAETVAYLFYAVGLIEEKDYENYKFNLNFYENKKIKVAESSKHLGDDY